MTKKITIPKPSQPKVTPKLPFGERFFEEGKRHLTFSFSCFDRENKLFNLGDNSQMERVVSGRWFISLLDCLKSISNMEHAMIPSSMHQLHQVGWDSANASRPQSGEDLEYWQFRLNKSTGRVIGFIIDEIFYVVWLDPHHNLTDSEGYGKAVYHSRGKSDYELLQEQNKLLTEENERLKEENQAYKELFDSI